MKKFFLACLLLPLASLAQKKPLDHTVYDSWEAVGERMISNDGKWIVYAVNPQEGDGTLYIQSAQKGFSMTVPRGYSAEITQDSRFVIFRIKPRFEDVRQGKIKKKKAEDMPKDSLGIVELGKDHIVKFDQVRSYKMPEKGYGWVAIQKESVKEQKAVRNKAVDSLQKKVDSLTMLVNELKNIKTAEHDVVRSAPDTASEAKSDKGRDLILYNLLNAQQTTFTQTEAYDFDKPGKRLVLFAYNVNKDSTNNNGVVLYSLAQQKADTVLNANEVRSFVFSEDGSKLAFMAEHGKDKKAVQKFFDLFLLTPGSSVAMQVVNKEADGMPEGFSVSENGSIRFSQNGSRLFFGTAPIPAPKDTSLVEIDLVKVDIWNYKDDYLQTQQLARLANERRRSYMAVYDLTKNRMMQLATEGLPVVITVNEGNADYVIATTDTGRRVSAQWEGRTFEDIYSIELATGKTTLVKRNLDGRVFASPMGKYIMWYDSEDKNFFSYDGSRTVNVTAGLDVPIYDELHDLPALPRPYGAMGWLKDDAYMYIYDRYDIWKVDPAGKQKAVNITGDGRAGKMVYRYLQTDREERFLTPNQNMLFVLLNEETKAAAMAEARLSNKLKFKTVTSGDFVYGRPLKALKANAMIYTKENYVASPDLFLYNGKEHKITATNPQQAEYNWGTAELFHWTTLDGNQSSGVLYKPEDFDPAKKYPVILYFYERVTDNLNRYIAPSPTPSRLNISFFVSRGYVVMTPDIAYTEGHPGRSAYNYIVSGAQALAKEPWIDADNIGIQGQSWGGYQVAHLITRTNMFKAAWAGAPVANMFSAYGGIRWESGMNRQFQYEKTQSRIGATIWERPDLYIENSPLFHLQDVNTPLVIMANDADGAVPWYQGIELFTGLRRLGKPVWMLNYNGEAHNLIERKNRLDIQIREQQFFDWLLKGEKAPKWITEGVRAIDKGRTWGLEVEDAKD